MRAKKLIFVLLPVAAFAFLLAMLNTGAVQEEGPPQIPPGLPYKLKPVITESIKPDCSFLVADVDRDGNDDILLNEPDRLLWYRLGRDNMTLAGNGVYERSGNIKLAADADGDGYLEYFQIADPPDGSMLSCYDWFSPDSSSSPRYTVGPLFSNINRIASRPWKRIRLLEGCAAPDDQGPIMLASLNPKLNEDSVRSVLAWHGRTGRVLWRYPIKQGQDLICDDFGLGFPRVVLTTVAFSSKPKPDGLNSHVARLVCLDARDGRRIWERHLGGRASRAYLALADVDADGRNEMIVSRSVPPGDSTFLKEPLAWNIAVLDGEGVFLRSKHLPLRPEAVTVANIDEDPYPEILVGGNRSELVMLDDNLDILRIVAAPKILNAASLSVFGVADLAKGHDPCIVCGLGRALVVIDHEGNTIAQRMYMRSVEPSTVTLAHFGRHRRIVVANSEAVEVLALKPITIVERARLHRKSVTVGMLAAALVGLAAVSQVRRLRKWHRDRGLSFDTEQKELLSAMSAYYHGGASLKAMDRIRFNLKNWERIRSEGATREDLVARLRGTFVQTVVPELRHIVILARRARVPEDIWRTLLSDAELAARELEAIVAAGPSEPARQREHIDRADKAFEDADESLARIRAHLRATFRTPAGEALERLVARFREEHGARGISFSFAPDASPAPAYAFISPVSFDKIFESLLSNAVRATEGRTGAEIAILLQEEGDYLRVDVRDNGCGIPRDDWDRVFDRAYTTKSEGGGFGLYYAREELAKFQGKIHVFESREGAGTTMRVVLRKSGKAGAA